MSRRLSVVCARGLFHVRTNIGRGNTRCIRNYSNAIAPSLATETRSSATEPPIPHHATDSVSIIAAGSAGYTAMFDPAAPGSNLSNIDHNDPLRLNQSASGSLANQANPALSFQPPSAFIAMTQHNKPGATTESAAALVQSLPPKGADRDKTVKPSKESGGVPNPTPEYLMLASHPPFLLPQPRNLLVVIDMNGTLLYRPNRRYPTRFVGRPFARPFLSYCVNTFKVVIWSSARPDNVENMCRELLTPEDRAKVVAVWGRDSFGLSKSDYNLRVQCYKRLTALWNNATIAASHPMAAFGEKWSQLNTVLVDDSSEKARSEPYNLIQIPDFTGDAGEPGFVLPQVHDYLNVCSQQSNVSAYMKSQPFQVKPEFTLSRQSVV
ncbi:hypothetical protein F4861DRAFT_294502 [Xylaria intraflava]|nr:hypothetical protein F4861DRAFT_294502 [Xylaria intraflava]